MRPRRHVETCQEHLSAHRKRKSYIFSPTDQWVLPAASTIKQEEREFVVDSGATMHMVSRKGLNSTELENVRISKSLTTVVTANGEVLTKEEATVYVRELDIFVTVMLVEVHRQFFHSENSAKITSIITNQWSQTTSNQKWQTDKMQHSERRTLRCPLSIDKLFKLSYAYFSHTFIVGNRDSHGASSINKK